MLDTNAWPIMTFHELRWFPTINLYIVFYKDVYYNIQFTSVTHIKQCFDQPYNIPVTFWTAGNIDPAISFWTSFILSSRCIVVLKTV